MTNTQTPSGNWSLYLTKIASAWHDNDSQQTQIYLGTVTGPDWQPRGIFYSLQDDESMDDTTWTVQLDGAEDASDHLGGSDDDVWFETRGNVVAAINSMVNENRETLNNLILEAQAAAKQA